MQFHRTSFQHSKLRLPQASKWALRGGTNREREPRLPLRAVLPQKRADSATGERGGGMKVAASEHDFTLGKVIRAYRMGYGVWRNFFVRLSGDGPFLVEVHPIELIPNNLHGKPYPRVVVERSPHKP
jgi:hypothetical protein